jgi:hypothetical protein
MNMYNKIFNSSIKDYQTITKFDSIPYFETSNLILPIEKQYKQISNINNNSISSKSTSSGAPLAKPESFSDLLNDYELQLPAATDIPPTTSSLLISSQQQQQHNEFNLNTSNMYYDDTMSYNKYNNEDELKSSNLVWWPYTDHSLSSTQNTTSKSIIKSSSSSSKQYLKNKINIIIENLNYNNNDDSYTDDDDLLINTDNNNNHISTSTPRTESTQESSSNYSTTNNNNNNNVNNNKRRSIHFLTSCYQQNEYKRFDHLVNNDSFMQFSLNDPKYTSSYDDKLCFFTSSFSNSSILSNINVNNNKQELIPNDQSLLSSSSSLITKLQKNDAEEEQQQIINESLTYNSIEKIAALRPQSNDYILCFDTSSIDNSNLSCSGGDDGRSSTSIIKDNNNENSYYLFNKNKINENDTNLASTSTTNNVVSDSGVDSARTLSPFVCKAN